MATRHMCEVEAEDIPPPLEDMSELLQQVSNLRDLNTRKQENCTDKRKTPACSSLETSQGKGHESLPGKVEANGDKSHEENSNTFCGFKKGFLLEKQKEQKESAHKTCTSNSKACVKNSENISEPDIPFIKPNADYRKEESLKMSEVQEALNASQTLLNNKDWLTGDLLEKVQHNRQLTAKLTDPKFMQAIAEFQTNPQAAMVKYQNDLAIQKCFQEFAGILGEHFSHLGEMQAKDSTAVTTAMNAASQLKVHSTTKPSQMTTEDEKKMQDILSKSEVRNVLMKPGVLALLDALRHNPREADRIVSTIDDTMKKDIRILIEAGLLQVER